MESYIERLEILRERANLYAEGIKDFWNLLPAEDRPLWLFVMETTACAIRKARPAIGEKADIMGKIFSSELVMDSVPGKENEE